MKTVKDKEYSFNHVKQRLRERYNLDITYREYCDLHYKLLSERLLKNDDNQFVCTIPFKGQEIIVTFCKKRGWITTVLPYVK